MLKLDQISTSYDRVAMLRRLTLEVRAGQLVCLLGPNGAGKSTSFNAICGLQPLDGGQIHILGENLQQLGTENLLAKGVGFVPEGRRLFAGLTVRENLRLAYDGAKTTLAFDERLEAMAQLFPRIKERLRQVAGTLSGGEQAMVALARALIGDPQLVIMDEPSLGLSPKLIDEYFEIVAQIRDVGKTVFLIEQNASAVLAIADYCYLIIRGEIATSGRAREMVDNDIVRQMYL